MQAQTDEAENELTSELVRVSESGGDTPERVMAQISVLEDGEWVGDFFANFTRTPLGGEMRYVADWANISGGNGIYVDSQPTFWPVEETAPKLNEKYDDEEFVALDTGPTDK